MPNRFTVAAVAFAGLSFAFAPFTTRAHAQGRPSGASLVRLLGKNAPIALAPGSRQVSALVAIPAGQSAESLGIERVTAGIGRLRGAPSIASFANAHPGIAVEVAPPLHTLLDQAGSWTGATIAHLDPNTDGAGVYVGVADTGLDVSHPDLLDASGHTRVAWMIDYSLKPAGIYPDLEKKFSALDGQGNPVAGAVLQGIDIDLLLAAKKTAPTDEVGHGTHVTSIAAGNGGITPHTQYVGIAPKAQIVFARVTRDASEAIDNDDLVRGVQFIFDRADAMNKPIAVNLSLGSDFGPHDGTFLWEQTLASYVGPDKPGHALVVAAGNSGSIVETPIHQSVRVTKGQVTRIGVSTGGATNGAVEVWAALREGAQISVGLDGPDGEWIAPVGDGQEKGKNGSGYNAGVINGSSVDSSPVPNGSHGAVVVWSGAWPSGQYAITLEGEGTVDLFLQGTGDAGIGALHPAGFLAGVREGTINLPATHPSIISVGCTVNRPKWTSIDKITEGQGVPEVDATGGRALTDPQTGSLVTRPLIDGETCWFSSAGPTVTGVPKPEISAPGGVVIAALSGQAQPGSPGSIFTTACPSKAGVPGGNKCLQVDTFHGVSQGTSMSAPLVAGAVALLFQRDPTLTQDKIVGLLQAGAHLPRGPAPFDDQGGPGELDVIGTLDALAQLQHPAQYLPSATTSWITVSAEYLAADGSTPFTAILELRTADGKHRADMFDPSRLQPRLHVNGAEVEAPSPMLIRRAPGLWVYTVTLPQGLGGASLTLGATFDGVDIVAPKTVPIAPDIWSAEYPSNVSGGCAVTSKRAAFDRADGEDASPVSLVFGASLALTALVRRRKRARP